MLLKDGAHRLTISITLLEFCNILLAVCTLCAQPHIKQLAFLPEMLWAHSSETFKANTYSGCFLTFSFGHCPNKGVGLPMPEFFGPFSKSAFLVNKKSLFLQKCQCIELLTVFRLHIYSILYTGCFF